ncbi:ATP-binding protein [Halococcus sediminicola]|uniref:ATP-binding protein n=1 Tax=Halococcus sediminicola TaxID=1264579 RepID=UPI000679DC9A|nr:DUF87 domain-containing protein [Halococcus sediminicola]
MSDYFNLRSLKQGRLLEQNLRDQIQLHDRLQELEDGSVEAEKLQEQLTKLQRQKLEYLQHPFQPINIQGADNSIELGQTENGEPYRIPLDQLTKHSLTVGETGAGKTNLNYLILQQLNQQGIPFWVFDVDPEYHSLLADDRFEDVLVIPWRHLKINPLYPPEGIRPSRWIQEFADLFGESQALISSRNLVYRVLSDCYSAQRMNPDPQKVPDLEILEQQIREYSPRDHVERGYRSRVRDRLETINEATGPLFDCRRGIPIRELVNRNVVFQFDGLLDDAQRLVMETLLYKLHLYRHQQPVTSQLRHVTIIDEAYDMFPEEKEDNKKGQPRINVILKRTRKRGNGILAADQEATKLMESLKANTATKILLPSTDEQQFESMSRSIGLDTEQKEWCRNQLETGTALVYNRATGLAPVDIPLVKPSEGEEVNIPAEMGGEWSELKKSVVSD